MARDTSRSSTWIRFLGALEPAAFARQHRHPAYDRLLTLDGAVSLYVWHGRHHTAHVIELRQRMGC